MCCDWNKYDAFSVATGAVDRRLHCARASAAAVVVAHVTQWHTASEYGIFACLPKHPLRCCIYSPASAASGNADIACRASSRSAPLCLTSLVQLLGHGYGVKRLRWSAHAAQLLLSCSYDTSVALRPPAAARAANLRCDARAAGAVVGGRCRRCGAQLLAASHGVCHWNRLGFVLARPCS